jgi:hypothetical protein
MKMLATDGPRVAVPTPAPITWRIGHAAGFALGGLAELLRRATVIGFLGDLYDYRQWLRYREWSDLAMDGVDAQPEEP